MLRTYRFSGSPKKMGEGFGETLRAEIRALYELRLSNAIEQALAYGGRRVTEADALAVSARCLRISEGFDPIGHAELVGIARGANLSSEQVFAMNGLTDLRDVLAWAGREETDGGCSSFIVQGDKTTDGNVLIGQTWDLATDNMPFVIGVHRDPADGPDTWCLTTVGCLSLIGMNEESISIGTTNLRTKDARVGVGYLNVIHKVLRAKTIDEAVQTIEGAPRAGAHYFLLADKTNTGVGVECSARLSARIDVERGAYVHCNHALIAAHAAIEADTPASSSQCRQTRMQALIDAAPDGSIDADTMKRFLGDHDNDELSVCRHDANGISSNGAVVMSPAISQGWACHGPPCEAKWGELVG